MIILLCHSALGNPGLLFLSVDLFWILPINGIIICDLLRLSPFTYCFQESSILCCSLNQHLIPFYCLITFHCLDNFVYSLVDRYLVISTFWLVWIVCSCGPKWTCFTSFGHILRNLLGHVATPCLTVWRNAILFS